MKRVLLVLFALAISTYMDAQSVVKYERHVDDSHVSHNCTNAFEASDGSIIMMEECCDTITDYWYVYVESVNLLKISPQGILIDSVKVNFQSTSMNCPFFILSTEANSNVMGSLYLNENNELHYAAVFFDDNLSISNTIDIVLPVEGFTTSYKSIVDGNNDLIFMSKKNDANNTYIFIRMDVYGEVKTVKHSTSENYKDLYLTEKSLYIHSSDPLEYGCYFINGAGSTTIKTVIFDNNFEIKDFFEINKFTDGENNTYVFDCAESEIMHSKGGEILMSSIVRDNGGWNDEMCEHIQLTKFNKEYEIVACVRVASKPVLGDEGHFYINPTKSILEDRYGNIYLIWINTSGEHVVSFISKKMELVWECHLEQTEADITWLYDAFIMEDMKLVVYGDYLKFDVGYYGICNILTNNSDITSVSGNANTISTSTIYPNPANDFIMIETENETEIKIYSVSGQMVLRQSISEGTNTIDVSKLNSGIYFIDLDGVMNKVVVR